MSFMWFSARLMTLVTRSTACDIADVKYILITTVAYSKPVNVKIASFGHVIILQVIVLIAQWQVHNDCLIC